MLRKFSEIAKEILRHSWTEPRDRPIILLGVFFGLAALLSFSLQYYPSLIPDSVRLFSLQILLFLFLIFLWVKGWRPRRGGRWGLLLLVAILYLGGLYLCDLLVAGSVPASPAAWPDFRWPDLLLGLVMAPILEELFFRDYLFRVLSHQGAKWVSAWLFTAAFFTLAHMSLYPGAFLLGLIAPLLYIIDRGVLVAMVFHLLCNASWYLLPRFFPNFLAYLQQESLLSIFYR